MENDKEVLLHGHHGSGHSSASSTSSDPSPLTATADIEDRAAWRGDRVTWRDDRAALRDEREARRRQQEEEDGEEKEDGRVLPVVKLVALTVLMLDALAGITFFILAATRSLMGGVDLPSRIVVLAASVVGISYVFLHVAAARTTYRKTGQGPPQSHGNYLHAAALLIVRLSVPLWVTSIVTTVLVVTRIGINLSSRFVPDSWQTIYINFIIAVTGLLSSIVLNVCIEKSSKPFATAVLSKSSFLAGESPSMSQIVRTASFSSQQTIPRKPTQFTQRQHQHRSLNSNDRIQGMWPGQNKSRVSSSVYSVDNRPPLGLNAEEDDGLDLMSSSPIVPAGTTMADFPINVPPIPAHLAVANVNNVNENGGRSPVHLAWRPPSHHGRKSLDASRAASRRSSLVPQGAVGVRGFDPDTRVPTLPDVFSADPGSRRPLGTASTSTTTSAASSNVRMTWAPSPHHYQRLGSSHSMGGRQSEERARRHTMVSPRSPFGTFGGGSSQQRGRYPPFPGPTPPMPTLRTPPRLSPQRGRRENQTPSPRARSLSSHPPFSSSRASSENVVLPPPAIPSEPSPGTLIRRPSTAPGPKTELLMPTLPQQARQVVKRKPVSGQGHINVIERAKPTEFVEEEDDEPEQQRDTSPSRTARRLMKQRERELARVREQVETEMSLRRAQTVNNFSRPLPRSRSLSNLHQRSASDQDQWTGAALRGGDLP